MTTRTPFGDAPAIAIWEATRACDLACVHCRARATPARDAGELTTAEAERLIETIHGIGTKLLVISGGDPMKRPDIFGLIQLATNLGLRTALTPSATPLMTHSAVTRMAEAGISRLAISIDGSTAETHDRFRGVDGSFDDSLRILADARSAGLETQVNTSISRHNAEELDRIATLVGWLGISLWSVFFVVPTGRAAASDMVSADEAERLCHRLYDLARAADFAIKTTAAPHFRRVSLQRGRGEHRPAAAWVTGTAAENGRPRSAATGRVSKWLIPGASTINEGRGFVFVSHRGEIYPSGFLPLSAGNVRRDDLGDVYRNSALFRSLRDPDALKGKCHACEFRRVCGGSRARAYAMTGDPLESDPLCAYVPPALAPALQ